MQNAVDKSSSTLRTIFLYLLGLLTVLLIHGTYFQLRQPDTTKNFSCVSAFNKPFVKPDAERRQEGYNIPKSESLTN